MEQKITQSEVNRVWETEWKKGGAGARALFTERMFVEGYPTVKKYISDDVKMILDVGAATGRYSVQFARDYPDAKIYSTDILESSLKITRELVSETGVTNITVQCEDATRMSFPDSHFDVVYSGMVLQILPDVNLALREMRRVLKPGGVLIVTTVNFWNFHTLFKFYLKAFNRPAEYYGSEHARSPRELRSLFENHSLDVIALDGFFPAYGIYRLKMYWKPAKMIGSILNRLNKVIDPWTGRFLSRHFGFEIFCVGRK